MTICKNTFKTFIICKYKMGVQNLTVNELVAGSLSFAIDCVRGKRYFREQLDFSNGQHAMTFHV